jgi:hypothetical protein
MPALCGEGGFGKVSPNITKGEGGGWKKRHMTIFCDFLTLYLPVLTCCHVTQGGGGG